MNTTGTKICSCCDKEKNKSLFQPIYRRGKTYLIGSCRECENKKALNRHNKNPEKLRSQWENRNAQHRYMRKNNIETERWILQDSRKSDRKKGRDNDLTREFIKQEIEKGCIYCGETSIRMTLDRIDNSIGHTMDNVTPACIRCNYVRGAMPIEAWEEVAKGMRQAREKELFGGWTGRIK